MIMKGMNFIITSILMMTTFITIAVTIVMMNN